MTTQTTTMRTRGAARERRAFDRRLLLLGAPVAALLAGIAGEWLDFRELRAPLLLMVGLGVLATAYALHGTRGGWRTFVSTVLIGVATWAGAQTLYAIIHTASGERFHADRLGPQWSQAIALIAAHGVFLGGPTGVAAAILLRLPGLRARMLRG